MSQEIAKGLWLHNCNRCDHEWTSRKEDPKTCPHPKCRSPYWNKQRVR